MEINNIDIDFTNDEIQGELAQYELVQNEPNPFTGSTIISYYLPKADKAVITVYDATGKMVLENKVDADAGENTMTIYQKQLSGSGVYYYELKSGDFTANKKMIMIE
jgi:pullulanase/glycogen debranching enzyme